MSAHTAGHDQVDWADRTNACFTKARGSVLEANLTIACEGLALIVRYLYVWKFAPC